jgi:hypothetical protein
MDLISFRKQWNADHKRLRMLFVEGTDLQAAQELFVNQHQLLHSATISGSNAWTFADEIFLNLPKESFRVIPIGEEHSLIWILWHISRIEDMTMQVLIAGSDQEYLRGGWVEKLASPIHHTGNSGPPQDVVALTQKVNPKMLLQYRDKVGQNTRTLVKNLQVDQLKKNVLPERLDRLVKEGGVLPEAEGLLAYWGKRVVFELLLMPPTRHLMVHLNEAWTIKNKLHKDRSN